MINKKMILLSKNVILFVDTVMRFIAMNKQRTRHI